MLIQRIKNFFTTSVTEKPYEPYNAIDVARFIVNCANDNDMLVSPYKLNYILYFVQLTFLQKKHRLCFKDKLIATSYGLTCEAIDKEFTSWKCFSIPYIKEYWDLSDGLWNAKKVPWVNNINQEDQETIIDVIKTCDDYSFSNLADIIRHQYPYMHCYNRFKKDNTITIDAMKHFVNMCDNSDENNQND